MHTLAENWVVTRKPHRCWGCSKTFPAGQRMFRVITADGGSLTTVYWCEHCNKILQNHRDEIGDPLDGSIFEGDVAEFERDRLKPQKGGAHAG